MKLFGKELFNFLEHLSKKDPEKMYDFFQWLKNSSMQPVAIMDFAVVTPEDNKKKKKKKEKKPKLEIHLTPKGLYHTQTLNANEFSIKTEAEYLNRNIQEAEYKLEIMGGKAKKPKKDKYGNSVINDWGAVRYGKLELESIIERLNNRYRIDEFKSILDEFPHTTNELVLGVIKKDSDLRCELAENFIPDFPKEAMSAMKKYNDMCLKLCGKLAIFYVIAQKKDFEKLSQRRDPILLAQSPFGFFWQILGAWDEEMIYLGDL